jgi:RNA polymerase sigma factor (sigma-70 family)
MGRAGLVLEPLRTLFAAGTTAGLTDAELLERFASRRDDGAEAAFAALVARHGPIVRRACRSLVSDTNDAEDVFQATFLILTRKARAIRRPELLGNWLYGTACRVARSIKTRAARRSKYEAQQAAITQELTSRHPNGLDEQATRREEAQIVHEEVARLPAPCRVAVVLCDLEGRQHDEVAHLLRCCDRTLRRRLHRGRNLLRLRLTRRGLAPAVSALIAASSSRRASAAIPQNKVGRMARAAMEFAAGRPTAGTVPAAATALAEGVIRAMFWTNLKGIAIAASVVVAMAVGVGSGVFATDASEGTPAAQERDQASGNDVRDQIAQLKQQLGRIQHDMAKIEREAQAKPTEKSRCDTTFLADRFKYRVPFEIGLTQTPEGGRIEIREVWGTRPRIEIGGQYVVRGRYMLPHGERGKLYFYATAGGPWGQTSSLDLQAMPVDQQEGEFALVHGMAGPGFFHLYLADPDRYSRCFANVYFGTGENVYREQHTAPSGP